MVRRLMYITAVLMLLALPLMSCGDDDSSVSIDGALLYGFHCVSCHGPFGAGGKVAGNVQGSTTAEIFSAIADPYTSMEILGNALITDEVDQIAGYLGKLSHAPDWAEVAQHGYYASDKGVAVCKDCHGTNLLGVAPASSCYQCHDKNW